MLFFKDLSWFASGSRFYKVTQNGYLVFHKGAHGGERPEEEDPEPQPRAITLYKYLGVIYRRKQTGEVIAEEDIHIIEWDDCRLEEETEIPIQRVHHRRHYFKRLEEEESEGEEDDSRIINVWLVDHYHNLYWAGEEEDNSNKGEDVDGEEGKEKVEEEENEEFEENEEDCNEEEHSKENRRNN